MSKPKKRAAAQKGTPVRYWGLSTRGQKASITGVAFTAKGVGKQVIDDDIPEMGNHNYVSKGKDNGKGRPAFTIPPGGRAVIVVAGDPDNFCIHVGDVYVDIRLGGGRKR